MKTDNVINQRSVIAVSIPPGFLMRAYFLVPILAPFVMVLRNAINETLLEPGGWSGRVSTTLSRA